MELWRVHKHCDLATLEELRELEKKLMSLIHARQLSNTNAEKALNIVKKYLQRKELQDLFHH